MSIRRAKRERGYSVISNSVYSNNQLSWRAMGMLSFILSKPDDWSIWPKALVKVTEGSARNDKIGVVYEILKELKVAGFVQMDKLADGGVEYIVSDEPQKKPDREKQEQVSNQKVKGSKKPDRENPDQAFPDLEKPDQGKRDVILNTERLLNPDLTLNPDLPTGEGEKQEGGFASQGEKKKAGDPENEKSGYLGNVGKSGTSEKGTVVSEKGLPQKNDSDEVVDEAVAEISLQDEKSGAEIKQEANGSSLGGGALSWPEMSDHERSEAEKLLKWVDAGDKQAVLDAWAWKVGNEAIESRVGIFGYLCKQAKSGALIRAGGGGAQGSGGSSKEGQGKDGKERQMQLRKLDGELRGVVQMGELGKWPDFLKIQFEGLKSQWVELTGGKEWGVSG